MTFKTQCYKIRPERSKAPYRIAKVNTDQLTLSPQAAFPLFISQLNRHTVLRNPWKISSKNVKLGLMGVSPVVSPNISHLLSLALRWPSYSLEIYLKIYVRCHYWTPETVDEVVIMNGMNGRFKTFTQVTATFPTSYTIRLNFTIVLVIEWTYE